MADYLVQVRHRTDAPATAVWEVLTDVEHAPEVLHGVTRVELLSGPGYSVGTEWLETRRIMRMEETQRLRVTEADAPRRTTVEADADGVHYRTVFTLAELHPGTEVTVTFSAEQPDTTRVRRVATAVLGPLGARFTRRVLARDLADIAARAEATAPG